MIVNFVKDNVRKKDMKNILYFYGKDILNSEGMQLEKKFIQHGDVSCYDHSVRVAAKSVKIVKKFRLKVNMKALIRGALLHDYFLYDWHDSDPSHNWHGFRHARFALKNANRDFDLGKIEKDIIFKHMFPLNIYPPKYKESWIVCLADKLCAITETFSRNKSLAEGEDYEINVC